MDIFNDYLTTNLTAARAIVRKCKICKHIYLNNRIFKLQEYFLFYLHFNLPG